jgi:hypothetical protein
MDEETRRIHRLLSDGKLSGPEAEEILDNVLAAVAREKPRPVRAIRYWAAGAGAVLAAAAAVLLVVYVPRDPGGRVHVPEEGDLAGLRVRCSPGELAACPASSKLVFTPSDKRASGFLSAYAELLGDDPKRTFFYSQEDGSPELPAQSAVRAVGLPGPARYRIHAVIADRPLTREELVEWAAEGAGGAEVRASASVELVVTD